MDHKVSFGESFKARHSGNPKCHGVKPLIVTLGHLRHVPSFTGRLGFCSHGGREWFAYYGLDWSTFVREGIDVEALEATGDALGLHLAAFARAEALVGQQ